MSKEEIRIKLRNRFYNGKNIEIDSGDVEEIIELLAEESAESPKNEETSQEVTKEIACLIYALKLAQSELSNINRKYYGDPVNSRVFEIIAEAIIPFEK